MRTPSKSDDLSAPGAAPKPAVWVPSRADAFRIAAIYAVVGALWILFSGDLLHKFVTDAETLAFLEKLKGWFYVSVTALLLGVALDRYFSHIRQSAQKIQDREEELRAVSDNLPEGYIFGYSQYPDRPPRFNYASKGVERVHGISVKTLLNDPQAVFSQVDPGQLPALAEMEQKCAKAMTDFAIELRIRRADGVERLIEIRSRPRLLAGGEIRWDGFATDITDRKQAEAMLRQQFALQDQIAKIAATVPGTIYSFRLKPDGSVSMPFASGEVEKVFGLKPEQVREDAMPIMALLHPDDLPRVQESIEGSARTMQPWREEFRARNAATGAVMWIEGQSVPQKEPDGSVLWHGFFQNITERKQLEAQLRQAQKMEGIGQLAGGVAHDFNNILAAMMMQAELVTMTENLPKEVYEGLEEIRIAAERAANLTRQLLLFSRRQVMQPRNLDLNEVVASLSKMLKRIIGEDVRLDMRLCAAPLTAHADAGMLDQVLLNLAVNSRDAMPQGGVLAIETFEFAVGSEMEAGPDLLPGQYVCLKVADSGHGISPEIIPRIFEPFFTTKETGKGTGLGLATVFGIVKQHRGAIKVESEPGRGATFQIFLPAITDGPAKGISSSVRPKPQGGSETILLAEDDKSLRLVTRLTLERQGYRVLEAANGPEAVTVWRENSANVSLLITDMVMPAGMSGTQLARTLTAERGGLRVLYVTGHTPEFAGRALELRDGEHFLQKPWMPDQLLETVRHCLDARVLVNVAP